MRVLLDTCTFLWMLSNSDRLGKVARERVLDPTSELLLSAASSWEIAIKVSLGRLAVDGDPEAMVPAQMSRNGIVALPVEHIHALRTRHLPHHHNDPFDRLLVAQAQVERLTVLTPDSAFAAYDVATAW